MKIIKFSASWCNPCKAYSPIFNKVKKNNPNIDMEEVNLEDDENIFKTYSIGNIPTTIFLDENDEVLYKKTGVIKEKELQKLIDKIKGIE